MTIDVEAIYEEIPDRARTPLGRRLLEIRSEIVKSGATTLGWDEIEEEVAARRGGWREVR